MKKYHMNKAEREVTDREELKCLLKTGKYASIAMCRDNDPYIVTLSYGYDGHNNCLYFHTALKGLKLDIIMDNPRVCATVIQDGGYARDQCAHRYFSAVMWGTMAVIDDLEEKKHALEVLLHHLEDNPDPIRNRNIKNDSSYNGVAVLKLTITDLTGKRGS